MIAPSILSADFSKLAQECNDVIEAGADWLHVDIMDGHFVPNITIGPCVVQSLRKALPKAFLDCHLMITSPQQYVQAFAKAGASLITFHHEAVKSEQEQLELIEQIHKLNIKVGISIKPKTQVSEIFNSVFEKVDMILLMTVEPGFGGQKYMPECAQKCLEIKQKRQDLLVEVDGGINNETINHAKQQKIDIFVAGSYVFQGDYKQKIQSLK